MMGYFESWIRANDKLASPKIPPDTGQDGTPLGVHRREAETLIGTYEHFLHVLGGSPTVPLAEVHFDTTRGLEARAIAALSFQIVDHIRAEEGPVQRRRCDYISGARALTRRDFLKTVGVLASTVAAGAVLKDGIWQPGSKLIPPTTGKIDGAPNAITAIRGAHVMGERIEAAHEFMNSSAIKEKFAALGRRLSAEGFLHTRMLAR
ncbi:MAG: twin-arginine translocation signal domain-containing protein [Anaerolineae bacterium]